MQGGEGGRKGGGKEEVRTRGKDRKSSRNEEVKEDEDKDD